MKRNNIIPFIILLLLTFSQSFAQSSARNYIIITQENEYSNGLEGIIRKYWIIPEDSIISSDSIKISPLILSLYYKNHIDSCIKGLDIDPITDPSMDLLPIDSLQDQALHKLFYLTRKNRKKIQTVEKNGRQDIGTQQPIMQPL
jgi:hypothetical protein